MLLPAEALAGANVWVMQQLSARAKVPLEIYTISARRLPAMSPPAALTLLHLSSPPMAVAAPSSLLPLSWTGQLPDTIPLDAPDADLLAYVFALNDSFYDCVLNGVVQASR